MADRDQETDRSWFVKSVAVMGGPAVGIVLFGLLRCWAHDLSYAGCAVGGIAGWMAVWWISEAVPLAVTALLPLVAFPLAGVQSMERTAAPYADKNIFLFMGGFLLALAMQRWNLHRRIALMTLYVVGTSPKRLVAGMMLATALVSLWISNTATAAMMLPIGLSVIGLLVEGRTDSADRADVPGASGDAKSRFSTALMLSIAYAASIGGMGTLVGTPTNLLLAGYVARSGGSLGFGPWMLFAVPWVAIYLTFAWWVLTARIPNSSPVSVAGGKRWIAGELAAMGSLSQGERAVLVVFLAVASAWVLREPLQRWTWLLERVPLVSRLDDSLIAISGAISLFILPAGAGGRRILDVTAFERLPWNVLLLFGGGFTLAAAIQESHLDRWLSSQLAAMHGWPPWCVVTMVVAVVLAATELTSNTPTLAAFLPVAASLATAVGISDLRLLVPATLAASCAFMLPVATPPNAIVFGSGHIAMRDMVRAGLWLNLFGLLGIPLYCWWVVPWVFGLN
jgi:sodium-dependent dicarboxylate transporter 2/3/5